jgi:hypothetical protein
VPTQPHDGALLKGFALSIVYAVVLEVTVVGVFTYAVMQL